MTAAIHLGYVVGTGEAVEIPLRHTAVTGQTQESGKTTTLEGLISRSGLQAVAYVTKRGESSFHVMNPIAPYFQERADWKFVQSLLEASTETKLKFEQSWIMRASEGAKTLEDVRANIRKFLTGVRDTSPVKRRKGAEVKERWIQRPAKGLSGDVYYVLNKYLDDIMPQLDSLPYSTELELAPGLNVMDLRDYEFPLQALVIRSVLDYTRLHGIEIINLVPEAWKFAPKQKGSPVRQSAEELIREGGALKNFLWIDSQDLAGVADVLMRQVGVWLFGVQRAKHEIERALDHMPEGLPSRRPRPADIATLQKGQFYVCFGREMYKVYVQPAWMTAAHAEAIARGEEEVDSAREILKEYTHEHKEKTASTNLIRRTAQTGSGERLQPGQDTDASIASQNRHSEKATDTRNGQVDGLGAQGDEETMWKEKYEALKKEFDVLKERIRLSEEAGETVLHAPTMQVPVLNLADNGNFDLIYNYVKSRAAKDPSVLQLLRNTPEIEVKRIRRTLEMSDTETPGRIAVLIADKFFDSPQNSSQVTKEFKRRGWFSVKTSNAAVLRPLADIAEMGFLTRDGSQYQSVPGMKVNIVEV